MTWIIAAVSGFGAWVSARVLWRCADDRFEAHVQAALDLANAKDRHPAYRARARAGVPVSYDPVAEAERLLRDGGVS